MMLTQVSTTAVPITVFTTLSSRDTTLAGSSPTFHDICPHPQVLFLWVVFFGIIFAVLTSLCTNVYIPHRIYYRTFSTPLFFPLPRLTSNSLLKIECETNFKTDMSNYSKITNEKQCFDRIYLHTCNFTDSSLITKLIG